MSGASAGPGENLDSAAKMMLEALTKASAELEKTVGVLTEQLSAFNQNLEKTFDEEIQAARERMESNLKQNLDGLIKDKDSVMKALADFKQSEIEKIIESGKSVRGGMATQVEGATSTLSLSVSAKMNEIRALLTQPEADMKGKYDETQKLIQAALMDAKQEIVSGRLAQEEEVARTAAEYKNRVSTDLRLTQQAFDAKYSQKKADLQTLQEQVLGELAQKHDAISAKIESTLETGMMNISQESESSGQRLKELSESGHQFFTETNQSFASSMSSLSGLLNGLYETQLNNLAAQSRTEILSAAQHADESLVSIKAELQLCLREFQTEYVSKFEALNTRLEKTLEEEARGGKGGMRGLKEDRVRDQLNNLFRRLGQEMIDGAANAARRLEFEFQKSIESFEQRIESAKTQACESLDRESKLMQKELTRSFNDFERQISELQSQTANLDKHGRDAANIVMTIRQANVEF